MPVQFNPRPNRPHIRMTIIASDDFRIWPYGAESSIEWYKCWQYCNRVNPACYHTPGEAARALHYGSEKK